MHILKKAGALVFLLIFLAIFVNAGEPIREDLNRQIGREPASYGVNVKQDGVDLFTGDAKFDIPLINLAGRNGLDLSVSLSYSSNVNPSRENKYEPSSWVGLGWSLGFGSITVNHQNTEQPFDDEYYFNGQKLLPKEYVEDPSDLREFITEIYDFQNITRIFNSSYRVVTWEVTSIDGTKYIYGYSDENVCGSGGPGQDKGEGEQEGDGLDAGYDAVSIEISKEGYVGNYAGDSYTPIEWKLKKIIDPTGNNEIIFCYEKDSENIKIGTSTSTYKYTRASYLSGIKDSIGRKVEFVHNPRTRNSNEYYDPFTGFTEPDGFTEHYQDRYLEAIEVKDPSNARISRFDFTYAFLGTGQKTKRLLTNITEKGAADSDILPATNFEYNTTGNYIGKIKRVTSPLKGIVEYQYQEKQLEFTSLNADVLGEPGNDVVPFLGNNFVVLYSQGEKNLKIYNWKGDKWEYEFVIDGVNISFSDPACSPDWVTVGRDYFTVFESGIRGAQGTPDRITFFRWHELEDRWDGELPTQFIYETGRYGGRYKRINKALKENHYPSYVVFFEGTEQDSTGCEPGSQSRTPVVIERMLIEGDSEAWVKYDNLGFEDPLYTYAEVYGAEKYFIVVSHTRAPGDSSPTTNSFMNFYWKDGITWRGGPGKYYSDSPPFDYDNPWSYSGLISQEDYFAVVYKKTSGQTGYYIDVYSVTDPFGTPLKTYGPFTETYRPISCTGTNGYFMCATNNGNQINIFSKNQYGVWRGPTPITDIPTGIIFDGSYDLFANDDYFIAADLRTNQGYNKMVAYRRETNNLNGFNFVQFTGGDGAVFSPDAQYYLDFHSASPIRLGDEYFSLFLPNIDSMRKYFFLNKIEATTNNLDFNVYNELYSSSSGWDNWDINTLANRDSSYTETIAEDRTDFAKMIKILTLPSGTTQLIGQAKTYPVVRKKITDPVTGDIYIYNYTFENGKFSESMRSAQYNKVTVKYPNNGKTVYRFFNGLNEDDCAGCKESSTLPPIDRVSSDSRQSIIYDGGSMQVTANFTQSFPETLLNGRLYETTDYDNNGNIKQRSRINWTAYQKEFGSWFVRKTAEETFLDGMTDVNEYYYYDEAYVTSFYNPQSNELEIIGNQDKRNGMIRKVKEHTNDPSKTRITKYDYAHEIYDEMNDKHILSKVYRTKIYGPGEGNLTSWDMGSFEDAGIQWHQSGSGGSILDTSLSYDGYSAKKIIALSDVGYFGIESDSITVKPNTQYRVSAYLKSGNLVGNFYVEMHCHNNQGHSGGNFHHTWNNEENRRLTISNQDWISREGTFTTDLDVNHCHILTIFNDGSYGTVYVDAVKLEEEANVLADTFVLYKDFGEAGRQPDNTSNLVYNGDYITTNKINSYDEFGNVLESQDGNENKFNQRYIFYDSKPWRNWNELGWNSLQNPVSENTYYSDGMLKDITDANDDITQYEYDGFNRLKKVIMPYDSNSYPTLQYEYNFDLSPVRIKSTKKLDGTKKVEAKQFYDGLGRLIQTQLKEDNNNYIVSIIDYDTSSPDKIYKEYMPFRSNTGFNYYSGQPPTNTNYTEYRYYPDPLQRIKEIYAPGNRPPSGNPVKTEYGGDTSLRWTKLTDENLHYTTGYTDILGNLVKVRDANYLVTQKETKYGYNLIGNLLNVTDQRNNVVRNTYDKMGRLITTNHPDAGSASYLYDNAGNLIQKDDSNTISTYYNYDEVNRLTRVRFSQGSQPQQVTKYYYDNDNKCSSQENTLGRVCKVDDESGTAEYYYDDRGRIVKEIKSIFADNLLENPSLELDNDADLIPDGWERNPSSSIYGTLTVEEKYHNSKSFKIEVPPSAPDLYYGIESKEIPVLQNKQYRVSAYVKTGVLTGGDGFWIDVHCHNQQHTGGNDYLTWDNDDHLLLSRSNQDWTLLWGTFTTLPSTDHCHVLTVMDDRTSGLAYIDAVQLDEDTSTTEFTSPYTIEYEYDRANNIKTISDPAGRAVSYNYNNINQLGSAGIVGGPILTRYQYNPTSTIDRINFSNGVFTNYRYTHRDWLRAINTWNITSSSGGNFQRAYTYDAVGNMMQLCNQGSNGETWWNNGAFCNNNNDLADFGYDNLDRILNIYNHDYYPEGDIIYEYDDTSNRKKRTISGNSMSYSYYTGTNRLQSAGSITYYYDDVGNLISRTGGATYDYDWSNRLTTAQVGLIDESYYYDYKGQRVRKTQHQVTGDKDLNYVYDQFGNMIYEEELAEQGQDQLTSGAEVSTKESEPNIATGVQVTGQAVKGYLKNETTTTQPDIVTNDTGGTGPTIIEEPTIQEFNETLEEIEVPSLGPLELNVYYDQVLKRNVLHWGRPSFNVVTGEVVATTYSFTGILDSLKDLFRALFSIRFRLSPESSGVEYLIERKVGDGVPKVYTVICSTDACEFVDLDELAKGITYTYEVKIGEDSSNTASVEYGIESMALGENECEGAGYQCSSQQCPTGYVEVDYSCGGIETERTERETERVFASPQRCCAHTETIEGAISYVYANGNIVARLK